MNQDDKAIGIAARVADGSAIDWQAVESAAVDDSDSDLLRALRAIADVATLHRAPLESTGNQDEQASATWGPLTVVSRVGAGRFGDVHLAWDARLHRRVALKLLHRTSPALSSPTRAIDEARLLARVRHPNVLTVHGAEVLDDQVGIWTEFIEGRTLEQVLADRGPLPADEVVEIGRDLCRALGAVHDAGLLHRDIKAQNVMRETGGRLVLMDFGTGHDLSRAPARDGDLTGTPLYLAPEILAGEPASRASDVYALGVLLFRLLTGTHPVTGRTLEDVRLSHTRGDRRRLDDLRQALPTGLVQVVERAIAPQPAARFSDAGAFMAALEGLRPGVAPAAAVGPQTRGRFVWAAVVTVTAALTFAMAWFGRQDTAPGPFPIRDLREYWKDIQPEFSADGRVASYVRTALYTRDLLTQRDHAVVIPGPGETITSYTFSPDRRRLAYVMHTAPDMYEQRVVSADGRHTLVLGRSFARVHAFDWSPDGRFIAHRIRPIKEGPFEIHLSSIDPAADLQTLDSGRDFRGGTAWSPDGKHLAVFISGDGHGDDLIRVLSMGATDIRVISLQKPPPGRRTSLGAWARAEEIFLGEDGPGGADIFAVNLADGRRRPVCERSADAGGRSCGSLDPTGLVVAMTTGSANDHRILLRTIATGHERPLTPEAVEEMPVGFSLDGRLFAFRSKRDGRHAVYVVPVDQTPVANPVKIVQLEDPNTTVGGKWFHSSLALHINESQMNLFRVDLDVQTGKPSSAPVRLTEDSQMNLQPFVSPDGRRIAYLSRSRPGGFAIMDANGARERVVKEGPQNFFRIQLLGWRSDDELIYADTASADPLPTAPKDLMVLNLTTLETRKVPAAPVEDPWPMLVRRDAVVFFSSKDQEIRVRPLNGGPDRRIAGARGWDRAAASADGRWLAYAVDASPADKPPQGEIRLRSLESGDDRLLVAYRSTGRGHAPLSFSPDGRFLAYRDAAGAHQVMSLETLEYWPLVIGTSSGMTFRVPEATWSPDGSFVVIGGQTLRSSWLEYSDVTHYSVTKLLKARK